MEKKKVVPTWLTVLLLVLIVAGIAYYVYDALRWIPYVGFSSIVITYAISLIDSILAVVYCIMGYKKTASGVFKAYCIGMTIGLMIMLYLTTSTLTSETLQTHNAVRFFAMIIQVGIWFVLTIAKDLGKKKALCLCAISLFLHVLVTIMVIPYGTYMVIGSSVGIIVYVISYIMFYCKYADKDARGAK